MRKRIISWVSGVFLLFAPLFWYVCQNWDTGGDFINAPPTTITVEKDSLLLGAVRYGDKKGAVFRFTNTGRAPLIIRDVRPSCGCTGVEWDKHPVKPGKSGEIKIVFAPNSLGRFIKNVEVFCNVEEKVVNLKLCGNVTE